MSTFRFQLAVSLDGYVTGPDQSEENPLGVGGIPVPHPMTRYLMWSLQAPRQRASASGPDRLADALVTGTTGRAWRSA